MSVELELRGITKRFPGVLANDHIDLVVESGEIHAIVGENGAGKTTLMSILYGLLSPDEGQIVLNGSPVRFHSPIDAIRHGLGMVHQAFRLFPSLTVAENVVFREEPVRRGRIDRAAAATAVGELAQRYGLAVDPAARVEDLPVGVLQRVEIIKALYRHARLLILDEPTAVLTPQEREQLFAVLRTLRADGHTIIFITHKLNEVMQISDRVTVLRDGRVEAVLNTPDTNPAEISQYMTGREVTQTRAPAKVPETTAALSVFDLSVQGDNKLEAVHGVSLTVHPGEIVGIAGVAGNGQTEMIEAIVGLRSATGRIIIGSNDMTDATVGERRAVGMSYVPEDRHGVGTAAAGTVGENLLMGFQYGLSRHGWLDRPAVRSLVARVVEQFEIRTPNTKTRVGTLSGGNLQKLVVGREMSHADCMVLVAEQPTRGVDIGAIEAIHQQLITFRDSGGAILLVSAELGEIRSLASRILVMYEGRIVGEYSPDTSEAELGLAMTGAVHA